MFWKVQYSARLSTVFRKFVMVSKYVFKIFLLCRKYIPKKLSAVQKQLPNYIIFPKLMSLYRVQNAECLLQSEGPL